MRQLYYLLIFMCCISVTLNAQVTETPLGPTDDSYVVTGSLTNNYNNRDYVEVRLSGETYSRQGYLKFDLASITGLVDNVKLRLYASLDDQKRGTSFINVIRVDNDAWTESTLVGGNVPTGTETLGGTIAVVPNAWNEIDITSLITTMDDDVLTLKLVSTTPVNFIRFDSKEGANGPELMVRTLTEVTDITIDQPSLSLNEGESTTLTATINPGNAFDQSITWSSTDESIATVDPVTGEVTGVLYGSANIIATANGGENVSDTISVMVTSPNVAGFSPTDDSYVVTGSLTNNYNNRDYVEVRLSGETYSRQGYLKFDLASINRTVESVKLRLYASLDDQKRGTSFINVIRVDNDAWTESTLVGGNVPTGTETLGGTIAVVPNIWNEIDITSLITTMGDDVLTLKLVSTTPVNFVRFDSKEGANGPKLIVRTSPDVAEITIDQSSLSVSRGYSKTLTATINPEGALDTSITWLSVDETIATVDAETGEVTGVSAGIVDIIAIANGGENVSDTLEVTVTEPVSSNYNSNVVEDAEVGFGDFLNVNNGSSTSIITSTGLASDTKNGLLKFNVNVGNFDVQNATLRMYVFDTSFPEEYEPVFSISRIDDDNWSESSVTGFNGPHSPSTSPLTYPVQLGWNELDITSLVSTMGDTVLTLRVGASINNGSGVTVEEIALYSTVIATKESPFGAELVVGGIAPLPDSVTIDQSSLTLEVGEAETLTATLHPRDIPGVIWFSEDPSIASVEVVTGLVRGLSSGTVNIIAQANGGEISDTLAITVNETISETINITAIADVDNGGLFPSDASLLVWSPIFRPEDNQDVYMKFDLRNKGISGEIESVSLRIFADNVQNGATALVQRIDFDDWTENNLNGVETVQFTSSVRTPPIVSSWNEIDITSLVNPIDDSVFTLKLSGFLDGQNFRVSTRESSNPPQLVITTTGTPSAPPIAGRRDIEVVDNSSDSDISIYPNPTSTGIITVEGIVENENATITVMDASGNPVYTEETFAGASSLELNLEELNQGMYFIYIQQGSSQIVKKIIKE